MVEPIDAAFEAYKTIAKDIEVHGDTICTEQDTRIKVIDRVFQDCLGWKIGEVFTEDPANGGYADYKFSINGRAMLIVEAKKDAREFGIDNKTPGRGYILSGPSFFNNNAKEGIQQAIRYCGSKNAELACVTNGREWIVFRGNRLGDGTDTINGMALVFPSTTAVLDNFQLFYELLSKDSVTTLAYRPHFQEAEGQPIRRTEFAKPLVAADAVQMQPRGKFSKDISDIMSSYFNRISGDSDPDLLHKCFVVTKESHEADKSLARISADVVKRLKDIDTDRADDLASIIERAKESKRNEFVVIVGTKGAGKSTFVDRFFSLVLEPAIASECVTARVNVAESDGDPATIIDWLNNALLVELEKQLFPDAPPDYDQLQGIFFGEYQRLMYGPLKHLYEKDKQEFKIEFGRIINNKRDTAKQEYIKRVVEDISANRKKLPVIIFDNADHYDIDMQDKIYQYARSIYENRLCLIIVPITDRTSWQLSRQGALQSYEHEALFLPTPSTQVILRKRIEYINEKIKAEKATSSQYFMGRGIALDIAHMESFVTCLHRVFLDAPGVSRWIGNLANNDVRRALDIARRIMSSPYIKIEDLFKAHVIKSAHDIKPWAIKRAIYKGDYDNYASSHNEYVQNIYSVTQDVHSTPLMGLRILQLLRDAPRDPMGDRYLTTAHALEYIRGMHLDPRHTQLWLDGMLKSGLCMSYDPTVTDIGAAEKIQLTPSGLQHLLWGTKDADYIDTMMFVTTIYEESDYLGIRDYRNPDTRAWFEGRRSLFIAYLLAEDSKHCLVPTHPAYKSQAQLSTQLQAHVAA